MTGILAGPDGTERIGAKKVLLASDGFGANPEMLKRYIPEMAGVEYIGAQGNTGDGIYVNIGSAVSNCSAYANTGNGIRTSAGSTVSRPMKLASQTTASTGPGISAAVR